jgi:hypothetical protein
VVRCVDPLVAKRDSGLAQPFPRIPKIFGQILRQRRFGGGPAVVRFALLDPLLAVVTPSTVHGQIYLSHRLRSSLAEHSSPRRRLGSFHKIIARGVRRFPAVAFD